MVTRQGIYIIHIMYLYTFTFVNKSELLLTELNFHIPKQATAFYLTVILSLICYFQA